MKFGGFMKKFFIFFSLLVFVLFATKIFAVEEKKSIAVFPLDTPVNSSSYSIYSNSANMFASDLVNSLQKYNDMNVVDISTGENILKSTDLFSLYQKIVKEYKQKYTINYEKADKISQALNVDYIAFVYGGFDTQKSFLKSNWKYRFQWIWANPVTPSAQLNINITLIDVKNHNYVLEENVKKDMSMDNFFNPSQNFGENIVPISQIKKFTKPNAQKIAQKIHSVIYPDINAKYSQKDAFIERFTPNGSFDNFGSSNDFSSTDSSSLDNSVKNSRKNFYKNWIQEKL